MLNKVILIGNLGDDPKANQTASGNAVANISVATSMRWKDKLTGEKKEATEWHKVVAFNRLAEIFQEYLKKGSQVYIKGQLKTRKWTDDQGTERYSTEIIASEMKMLGVKRDGGQAKAEQQVQSSQDSPQDYENFDYDTPF